MTKYDFSGLTPTQQRVLTFQGWDTRSGWRRPTRAQMQPLITRGLVEFKPLRVGGTDPRAYEVPLPVHIAWCQHCEAIENASKPALAQPLA